jgi:hypothetical protein
MKISIKCFCFVFLKDLKCFFWGAKFSIFVFKPEKLCFQHIQWISVKFFTLAYNSPDFERKYKIQVTRFLQQVPASSQKNENDVKIFFIFIPDL